MNIVISGAKGQLGSKIKDISAERNFTNFLFTDIDELDITNKLAIFDFFNKYYPDVFVNCAAYTAVESAEENYEKAYNVNALGPENIAEACKLHNTKLIHISTDYVYDGQKNSPYLESDETNPLSVYGKTKLIGENKILNILSNEVIIIRTSWLYSEYGNNFVKTILSLSKQLDQLKVVNDQIGNPTYAGDLANTIIEIIFNFKSNNYWHSGIYHYSNEGECSWYDFAKKILELKDIFIPIIPVSSIEFPTKAKRPKYTVLDKSKIKNTFGIHIPQWMDSLENCLKYL